MKRDHRDKQRRDGDDELGNVVRLPRDWLGPRSELVPFGPSAEAQERRQAAPGDEEKVVRFVPAAEVTLDDFWGGALDSIPRPVLATEPPPTGAAPDGTAPAPAARAPDLDPSVAPGESPSVAPDASPFAALDTSDPESRAREPAAVPDLAPPIDTGAIAAALVAALDGSPARRRRIPRSPRLPRLPHVSVSALPPRRAAIAAAMALAAASAAVVGGELRTSARHVVDHFAAVAPSALPRLYPGPPSKPTPLSVREIAQSHSLRPRAERLGRAGAHASSRSIAVTYHASAQTDTGYQSIAGTSGSSSQSAYDVLRRTEPAITKASPARSGPVGAGAPFGPGHLG